ncbi:MinD/ParA family protein [Streptomyces sp. NPDC057966]|uniref:MinD/ParA family ATP-binding protein n=1 Tax=Streptomyces sp. NPDC057966 TaxID=3346292 RepID=UPI0036E8AD89
MPVTALVSAKSSGVTTSALALTLASKRPSLLAECDPAGGTVRAGFLEGEVTAGYGLYHLAAAERTSPDALAQAFASHLWDLDEAGHRKLLPGLTDPAQAAALTRTWASLAEVMQVLAGDDEHDVSIDASRLAFDVFIDAGRLAFESGHLHTTLTPAPLLHQADLVLLVVRGTEQSLTLARHVIKPLRTELAKHGSGSDALGLLLIEDGPNRSHRVAQVLETPVLAGLPHDPATAAYLTCGGNQPRNYSRSPLLKHARTATEQIEAAVSRRLIQQQYPPRPTNPQLAGVLQRLSAKRGRRG